jgi:AraC family carnitine catabolism transcriptional activator
MSPTAVSSSLPPILQNVGKKLNHLRRNHDADRQMMASSDRAFQITVIVTPRFNLAPTVCFLDPFRAANYLESRTLYQWQMVSIDGGAVTASNGLDVVTASLADTKTRAPSLAMVSASWTPEAYGESQMLAALRRLARQGAAMGGIDTGAFLLAAAGLLDDRCATVHYEHLDAFAELYPKVDVREDLYFIDGDRMTCAGGIAATDLALQIIQRQHGPALANAAAHYIFHDRLRAPGERQESSGIEPLGATTPKRLRDAIRLMGDHLEEPMAVPDIAKRVGLSQRQLERLFADNTGMSPIRYYRDIRLDRARGLITQTDMPVLEVALACGFFSPEHFSRAYRLRFGIAPREDRVEGRIPFEFRAWPMHTRRRDP